MKEYNMVLIKLGIAKKLLMCSVPDVDKYRNKEDKTEEDKAMLSWLLYMRKPIEEEVQRLEDYRQHLWNMEYENR